MFTRADEMLRKLKQSRLDNSRDVLMTQLSTVDLLIIDDFALEPMSRKTAEWLATFDDVLLARSAADRFKNAAFDLIVDGESYRARLKPKVRDDDPPPAAPVSKPEHPHPQEEALTRDLRRPTAASGEIDDLAVVVSCSAPVCRPSLAP